MKVFSRILVLICAVAFLASPAALARSGHHRGAEDRGERRVNFSERERGERGRERSERSYGSRDSRERERSRVRERADDRDFSSRRSSDRRSDFGELPSPRRSGHHR